MRTAVSPMSRSVVGRTWSRIDAMSCGIVRRVYRVSPPAPTPAAPRDLARGAMVGGRQEGEREAGVHRGVEPPGGPMKLGERQEPLGPAADVTAVEQGVRNGPQDGRIRGGGRGPRLRGPPR